MNAKEREAEFRKALNELLLAYDAELEVGDDGKGYGMHRGICTITMVSQYKDGIIQKEFCEFTI